MPSGNQTYSGASSSTGRPGKRSAEGPADEDRDSKRRKGTRDDPIDLTREKTPVEQYTYIANKEDFIEAVKIAVKDRLDPEPHQQRQNNTYVDPSVLEDAVHSYFSEKRNVRSMLIGDAILRERDLTFAENIYQDEHECSDALSKFIKDVGELTKEYNKNEHKKVFGEGQRFDRDAKPDFGSAMRILEAIDKAKSALHEVAKGCDSRPEEGAWPKPSASLQMGNAASRDDRREDLAEMERIIKQRSKYRADFVSKIGKFEADIGKIEDIIVQKDPNEYKVRGEFSIKLGRACKEFSEKEAKSVKDFEAYVKETQSRARRGR